MKLFFLIFLLVLSVFSVLPFFQPGFFSIHDDTQIARTSEMMNSLQDGMFPVRWVENLGYGYGYPIFNYYAPFPYYVSGVIGVLGTDALIATKAAFVIATVLAGILMYLFVKEFLGKIPAFAAAVVYLYFPYHAVNIYVRGNLNEVFAYAFFPIVLLGFYKLYYLSSYKLKEVVGWCVVTGVGISLIVISHNLSAYMTALVLGLLTGAALIFKKGKKKEFICALVGAGGIGLGLSAFYWLPVLLEMNYSDVISQVGGGADYPDHFVCLAQYWNSPWGFGGSGPGCVDGMSFKLGKINVLLTAFAVIALFCGYSSKRLKERQFLLFSMGCVLLFAIFVSTQYSAFLWQIIPRIDFLQFPWRFINFAAIAISVLIAGLVYVTGKTLGNIAALLLGVGVAVSTIFLHAELFVPQTSYDRSAEYYTNTNFVRWETSKISDEYMPPRFAVPQSEAEVPREKILVSTGSAVISELSIKAGYLKATIDAETESRVLLTIAPFPAWEIQRNGRAVDFVNKNNGIELAIPRGESEIEARFVQTPVQKIGNGISAITLFGLAGMYLLNKKNGKKAKK